MNSDSGLDLVHGRRKNDKKKGHRSEPESQRDNVQEQT
jgi:hypothetical protein